ncbi:MAG: ATP-binding protein [Nitrospinae bacterium]|nr:ATP-binding protein [Nitrospinota bacterium]
MFRRIIELKPIVERKSVFLFGPRQTGKSYYLRKTFPDAQYYDLLKTDLFFRLSSSPHLLREELLVKRDNKLVIIDEVQKLPVLLDEVHALIEEHDFRFILTGSSARKLKYGSSNLLGGRALTKRLFPLVTPEIPQYNLERILNFGSLPSIYNSPFPLDDLEGYIGTYLKEEIHAEGLVRKLGHFSKFLNIAAFCNAEMLNFAGIGSDVGLPGKTISEYFRVLEDTLIGSLLQAYTKTTKRKAISTAKFYFFDVGVSNILAGRSNITPKTELFGKAFEHFIFLELKAWVHYRGVRKALTYWRSKSGYEVDFLLGDDIAIEVKGTERVTDKHLKGLKALSEDISLKRKIVVSLDPKKRLNGDIEVFPYHDFLDALWGDDFL